MRYLECAADGPPVLSPSDGARLKLGTKGMTGQVVGKDAGVLRFSFLKYSAVLQHKTNSLIRMDLFS